MERNGEVMNIIEMPKFDVSQRSTRKRFHLLIERRKVKKKRRKKQVVFRLNYLICKSCLMN